MSKPTVLVVDDEIGIRRLVQAILEEAGCHVLLAGAPSQALQLVAQDPPDMAIVDYMLPEMDGITLGRRLRDQFGNSFPLIFMSAMDVPMLRLGELSSYLFIAKPFDIGSMVEAVESALAPVQPRPLNAAVTAPAAKSSPARRRSSATG